MCTFKIYMKIVHVYANFCGQWYCFLFQALVLLLSASDVMVLHCSLYALIGLAQRSAVCNMYYLSHQMTQLDTFTYIEAQWLQGQCSLLWICVAALGSSSTCGRGHHFVFLGKTLYPRSASLYRNRNKKYNVNSARPKQSCKNSPSVLIYH